MTSELASMRAYAQRRADAEGSMAYLLEYPREKRGPHAECSLFAVEFDLRILPSGLLAPDGPWAVIGTFRPAN